MGSGTGRKIACGELDENDSLEIGTRVAPLKVDHHHVYANGLQFEGQVCDSGKNEAGISRDAYVASFVDDVKAPGFVGDGLACSNQKAVAVAHPAPR